MRARELKKIIIEARLKEVEELNVEIASEHYEYAFNKRRRELLNEIT